jgi:lambda family phage portal protein
MAIWDRFFKSSPVVVNGRSSIPHVARRQRRSHGGYEAAGHRTHYGDFGATAGSADFELSIALPKIRNKVRALARNSGTLKRYTQLLKDNVVGADGFTLQVRVKKADGTPDLTLNNRAEAAWRVFSDSPTVDGVMDMVELEKQMATTWGRDGEYILEIVSDRTAPDGFRLNPIEGDILDVALNTTHTNGNLIKMGVELTTIGRPVAYHFLNQHPGDSSWMSPDTRRRYRRVPADQVIHVYERLRPGQTRGEPPASSIPNTVKMLDGYREAEVTGRRIKSSTMGFFTETAEAQAGAGGGLDGMADETNETTGDLEMDLEPGTFKKLPRGIGFETFDPGGASTDYSQFEAQVKTDASMGVSISPVSLGYETGKLSYSTHRGLVAEDRDMYRGLQSFFIRMAMKRIFSFWLQQHVAFNVASEIPPSRVLAIMAAFKFMARGWVQIDPTKDTKAENEQLAARTTSLSRIAANRGISRDDLLDEIEDDERALSARGLTQSFGGGNNAQTTSAKDDDDDDD